MRIMETLKLIKTPIEVLKYAGRQLCGGAWGELGERYGAPIPAPLAEVVQLFPHGLTLKTPVEHGWNRGPDSAA